MLIRPARAEELQRTQELIVRSINDLTKRHGFGPMASVRTPHFQLFSLQDDPDGLWTAEEDGQIRGSAFSWFCGDFWFLAELFVEPGQQGRGLGNALMQRTLQHAAKTRAANKALITFAFNTVSQSLYIRHGLFPKIPIYLFRGERAKLPRIAAPRLRAEALQDSAQHLQTLTQIDARTLGFSREKHHRYLIGDAAVRGSLLYAGNDCVGYAYVNNEGHIGPLAAARPDTMNAVFSTALALAAATGAQQVSAFIPGASGAALAIAIEHSLRISFPMLLMAERDFGDWSCYLPRNPGFM